MNESMPSSVQPPHAAQKPRSWLRVRRADAGGAVLMGRRDCKASARPARIPAGGAIQESTTEARRHGELGIRESEERGRKIVSSMANLPCDRADNGRGYQS